MVIKLYGSNVCSDTPPAKELLIKNQIEFDYIDITESMANLKEFLILRDKYDIFKPIKAFGHVGIPVLVINDTEIILEINEETIKKINKSLI